MPVYSFTTPVFQIPFMGDGDTMDAGQERLAHTIIENQLRGGVLGAGGTRVLQEGTYSVTVNFDNTTNVDLSGSPAVQGFANQGLVEVFGTITWDNIAQGGIHYLYVRANTNTYADPSNVDLVESLTPITATDHLLLASIDTTNATPSTIPTIDTNPPGKATAFNLFELLNNNTDPFGPSLTQSILTVLQQLTVRLGRDRTALFQQINPDATLPVISIENAGDQPEIYSSGELRLADTRVIAGFALSDNANAVYQGVAVSIIGALNEILTELLAHIADSTDPHGPVLTQTELILLNSLTVPQIIINPTALSPPSPPGSPPTSSCQIQSTGELNFCDIRSHLSLSEPGESIYGGIATSIIGALNELLGLIAQLSDLVGSLVGTTLSALSPICFSIVPDDIGYPLHFKLIFAEDDFFTNVTLVRESKISAVGWFYESQDLPPPSPPTPPKPPGALPGVINVPNPFPLPSWQPLPNEGLLGTKQTLPDGTPIRVQYRPQLGDNLFLRRHYRVAIQEFNLDLGDAELASIYFS